MLVPPAIDSELLRLKARSRLSLYPGAEHIVGTQQLCAEEWVVSAVTGHLHPSLDTEQDPIPADAWPGARDLLL